MLATDRDLLALEPRLFHDVAWLGQRAHASESVEVQGGGVTVVDASGPFVAGRIGPGAVLLLDDVAVEVTSVVDPTTASVSLVRARSGDPPIPAGSLGATARLAAFTFRPQLEIAHRQALALFGLSDEASPPAGLAPVSGVVDASGLALVEALGALRLIHEAAAPIVGSGAASAGKAGRYASRHAALVRSLVVGIDDTGDGAADRTVRATTLTLRRV